MRFTRGSGSLLTITLLATTSLLGIPALAEPSTPLNSSPTSETTPTRTAVAGAFEGTLPVIPTSVSPSGEFMAVGSYRFTGTWVGVVTLEMKGTLDHTTGNWQATSTDVFRGTWTGDGSRGEMTWQVRTWGNFLTGANWGEILIVTGAGSPTFDCSHGSFTFDGVSNPVVSIGGYSGTWVHGCPD